MGKRKLLLLRLLSLFRPYTGSLACISSCLLLYTGLSLASPLLSKYLIDEGILKQDYARVLSTAGLMAVLATATFVVDILKEFLRSKIAAGIKSSLFCDGFSSLLGINLAYFKDTSPAVIL